MDITAERIDLSQEFVKERESLVEEVSQQIEDVNYSKVRDLLRTVYDLGYDHGGTMEASFPS